MKRFVFALILAASAVAATGNAFSMTVHPECPGTPPWCDYCGCV